MTGKDKTTRPAAKIETAPAAKGSADTKSPADAKSSDAKGPDPRGPADSKGPKVAEPAKADGGDTGAAPAGYSRGEGQKPVTQAYKDNWNAIYGEKPKTSKPKVKATRPKKPTATKAKKASKPRR